MKDFGAKGDGVTDDSAAFAAALASGAGEVRADNGTYVVNSVITLAKGQKMYFGVGTHTVGGIRFTDSSDGPDRDRQDRMRGLRSRPR